MKRWLGLIEEYKKFLPVSEATPKLTLNEGEHHYYIVPIFQKFLRMKYMLNMKGQILRGHLKIAVW